jgi:hypothetical protein
VLLLIASNISMSIGEEKKPKRKDDGRDQNPVYQRVQEAKKKLEERTDPPEEEVPREEKSGPEERPDEVVQVRKENVIVIDEVSGESIPPLNPTKKLEPKYDYDEPLAFKEKDNK